MTSDLTPTDLCCSSCQLPEPIDDALHEGQLLCLSCAELCTCTEEIRVTGESPASELIVATPSGPFKVKARQHPSGAWVVDEFVPELKLMPGDMVEVEFGVVTGVRSVTDYFMMELLFHPLVEFERVDLYAQTWRQDGFLVEKITPQSLVIAHRELLALKPVEEVPDVLDADLLRMAGDKPDLVWLAKKNFPVIPQNGE
jgi:hypothetical protein